MYAIVVNLDSGYIWRLPILNSQPIAQSKEHALELQ